MGGGEIGRGLRGAAPDARDRGAMDSVVALVLTHMRPASASNVVRSLIRDEGFAPSDILLVVDGAGGLDDPALERQLQSLRLPLNVGPAGGLEKGLEHIRETTRCDWIYVCEDDVPLAHLSIARVRTLVAEAAKPLRHTDPPIGAVVAWGRHLDRVTGHTRAHTLSGGDGRLQDVDLSGWGATLLSRRVIDAGILPDPDFYFGYEDWDFWLRMREAGFRLVLDSDALRPEIYGDNRGFLRQFPLHGVPWRGYYQARNFFELQRRYGGVAWAPGHLARSAQRLRRAQSWSRRAAISMGLVDGLRGKLGKNPRFVSEASGTLRGALGDS